MKTCQSFQENFLPYLNNELDPVQQEALKEHLQECKKCELEFLHMQRVWQVLGQWDDEPVSPQVASSILAMGKGMVVASGSGLQEKEIHGIFKFIVPLVLGLVATLLSSGIIFSRMEFFPTHPLKLMAIGSLWTFLYTVVFSVLLYENTSGKLTSWRSFAKASLVAIGLFSVFTLISPVPHSIHFCRYYSVTQPLFQRLSVGGSFFLFGALYALIPMAIAAYLSGGISERHFFTRGSLAGLLFILLVAPGIYLQCAPFTIGVLLVWFGGTVVGSVIGGVMGLLVRYQVKRAS